MHIGIITYQTGHLKTWQLLTKLLTKPYDVSLYAFPFQRRPQSEAIFPDRPYQLIDMDIERFCDEHHVRYVKMTGWDREDAQMLGGAKDPEPPDVFLTCIAKIIPESFITGRIIINAHPGLLPENRGLDAFKWAIVNGWPLGASIHAIDETIDGGTLLYRIRIPVFPEDTFHDAAERAYGMECELQANFDYYLSNLQKGVKITDWYPRSTERLPEEINVTIDAIFQEKKNDLIELSRLEDPLATEFRTEVIRSNRLG